MEILASAKWAQDIPADRIPVLMLAEPSGVHLFQIGMREGIIESLEKAQKYYSDLERYEICSDIQKLIESIDSYGTERLHRTSSRAN
jgi:hypothetical protein